MNQARPKYHATIEQIPFDPMWLGPQGHMTNALPLLEQADKEKKIYMGFMLINDLAFLKERADEISPAAGQVIRGIWLRTVKTQWTRAFQFRIGQGEIWHDAIDENVWSRVRGNKIPCNSRVRIRPHMTQVHAVDRSWNRIDSDVAELERFYPYTKYADVTDPSLPETSWIGSYAFDNYCPDFLDRWIMHVDHFSEAIVGALVQDQTTKHRAVAPDHDPHFSTMRHMCSVMQSFETMARMKGIPRIKVNDHQRELLKRLTALHGEHIRHRPIEGFHVRGEAITTAYTTDEEYQVLVTPFVQLMEAINESIDKLNIYPNIYDVQT